MKTIKFNECKSYEDIENTIIEALKYDTVVENDSEAEKFFAEAGLEGEVSHNVIISTRVSIWNEEYNGEEEYSVIVTEHYTDSGRDDYVYSYSIC